MARLYRPYIPLSVRVQVAERQFAWHFPNGWEPYTLFASDWTLKRRLEFLLFHVARALECEVKELRLDHDPALCNRPRKRRGLGGKTYYFPDANDPKHLIYRSSHAHDIKTRVRGDGAQHSDLALLRIAKRRERKRAGGKLSTNRLAKPAKRRDKKPWPNRPMPKGRGFPKRRG